MKPGRVTFKAPLDYDYWFEDPPVVASNKEGNTVVVEFGDKPPTKGIRISPRVTVLIDQSGRLVGFYFRDVEIK